MEIQELNFGPFVMKTKCEQSIIDDLLLAGSKLKNKYNHKLASIGIDTYKFDRETEENFYSRMTPYMQAYRNGHCKFHRIENLDVQLRSIDLWINYMRPGDFNPIHTHGGAYSFVLFLDVPEVLRKEQRNHTGTTVGPGELMFEYAQQARPRWATTGFTISPQPGDFIIFPALLQHWVVPFRSDCTRISVSGNMEIANRDKLPHDYF
jgi:hypothetical protein